MVSNFTMKKLRSLKERLKKAAPPKNMPVPVASEVANQNEEFPPGLELLAEIPSVRLGGRRVLFHWPSIEAALLRKQKGGVP
jgi:hypothetical protein